MEKEFIKELSEKVKSGQKTVTYIVKGKWSEGVIGMSMWADYAADNQFEREFPFGLQGETWHSKNGDIKVSDMTDVHIKNCMKVVGEDNAWYDYFRKILDKRKKKRGIWGF